MRVELFCLLIASSQIALRFDWHMRIQRKREIYIILSCILRNKQNKCRIDKYWGLSNIEALLAYMYSKMIHVSLD